MKKIFTLLSFLSLTVAAFAQPILGSGFGRMAGINGTTYTKTIDVGATNYQYVSASKDGSRFYAASFTTGKLYILNTSFTFIDSMAIELYDIASSNEQDILFGLSTNALYRINTATKTVVDSIVIPNAFRLEERPNAKEVWVSVDNMIHVVDYTSGLTKTSITVSSNLMDYYNTKFTKGGSIAYKIAAGSKKIYKINAATKTIIDSASTGNANNFDIEVSTDSSKVFASLPNAKKILIYQASNMALVDSITSPREVFTMYRHPSRAELWAVNHFQDTVTIYNEDTKAIIATIRISPSPYHLAFATGSVGIKRAIKAEYPITVYPNPAQSQLTIKMQNGAKDILLYDITGRTIASYHSNAAVYQMNISDLASGRYFIAVLENNDMKGIVPFMKE